MCLDQHDRKPCASPGPRSMHAKGKVRDWYPLVGGRQRRAYPCVYDGAFTVPFSFLFSLGWLIGLFPPKTYSESNHTRSGRDGALNASESGGRRRGKPRQPVDQSVDRLTRNGRILGPGISTWLSKHIYTRSKPSTPSSRDPSSQNLPAPSGSRAVPRERALECSRSFRSPLRLSSLTCMYMNMEKRKEKKKKRGRKDSGCEQALSHPTTDGSVSGYLDLTPKGKKKLSAKRVREKRRKPWWLDDPVADPIRGRSQKIEGGRGSQHRLLVFFFSSSSSSSTPPHTPAHVQGYILCCSPIVFLLSLAPLLSLKRVVRCTSAPLPVFFFSFLFFSFFSFFLSSSSLSLSLSLSLLSHLPFFFRISHRSTPHAANQPQPHSNSRPWTFHFEIRSNPMSMTARSGRKPRVFLTSPCCF